MYLIRNFSFNKLPHFDAAYSNRNLLAFVAFCSFPTHNYSNNTVNYNKKLGFYYLIIKANKNYMKGFEIIN